MNDTSKPTALSSKEDAVAELEAAAAKWVLEKNKYTLGCLRDARAAVLKLMTPVETPAQHVCVGKVVGQVEDNDLSDPIDGMVADLSRALTEWRDAAGPVEEVASAIVDIAWAFATGEYKKPTQLQHADGHPK